MELEKLDLMDFYKDEYSFFNGGEGIGGVGVITQKQVINVVNLPLIDDLTKEVGEWGSGYHIDTFRKVLEEVFELGKNEIWVLSTKRDKEKIIDALLEQMINIRYINECKRSINKSILIKIPPYITKYQYQKLQELNEEFEVISKKYNVSIKVLLHNKVFYSKELEVGSIKIFDIKKNNLGDAIDYIKENECVNKNIFVYKPELEEKIVCFSRVFEKR